MSTLLCVDPVGKYHSFLKSLHIYSIRNYYWLFLQNTFWIWLVFTFYSYHHYFSCPINLPDLLLPLILPLAALVISWSLSHIIPIPSSNTLLASIAITKQSTLSYSSSLPLRFTWSGLPLSVISLSMHYPFFTMPHLYWLYSKPLPIRVFAFAILSAWRASFPYFQHFLPLNIPFSMSLLL